MTLAFAPERIEQWPLARLQPYAKNAKLHGADQVAKLAASMAEFGWTVPCLVGEDGELIAGHGRVLAATQLGLTEAPVIVLGHLTEAQRRAYRIADNKLTELGSWDEALLSAELNELLAEDFDLSLVGFSDGELDKLLAFVPESDGEDAGAGGSVPPVTIPEPPRNPASRTGDLWILGDPHIRQRLFFGAVAMEPGAGGLGHRLGAGPQGWLGMPERPDQCIAGPTGLAGGLADADGRIAGHGQLQRGRQYRCQPQDGEVDRLDENADPAGTGATDGVWRDPDWLLCRDGRWRPVEPGTFPLADGVSGRMGLLRGYGNAIVPPLAAEFVTAFLECLPEGLRCSRAA